jgi:peptidoglycan/LPS O-acetylase OafA/YrhL
MDLRRLRAGEWIAGGGGLLLLISLFLPWYGAPDATGWESLAVIDLLLAVVALSAIALLVVTAVYRVPALPIALAALLSLAGIVGVVLALVRVAWLPDGADSREWGLWLALAGVLAVAVGAWVAMSDQRLSKPGRPTDLSGRPIAEFAEIEHLPAPGPGRAESS